MTPPGDGADMRHALLASCLRGAMPPRDWRAPCIVRPLFRDVDCVPVNVLAFYERYCIL
jgi:hypothetical protein